MSETATPAATLARAGRDTTREALRELRTANRLREEQLRAARLESAERLTALRQRQLAESLSLDWVTPYAELFDAFRQTGDPLVTGPTSFWQRKRGQNWPVYQTEQELALLRAPARLLLATNGYAQGLVEGLTSYVIGSGCTFRVGRKRERDKRVGNDLLDAVQAEVDDILEEQQWHGGEQPGLEEELFGRSIEDGEFLLAHFPQQDGTCEFRVQESEQLTQPPGSDPLEYSFGILTPRDDTQKHQRYYLQWGDTPAQGDEHDADRVTHFRRNVRRTMKRGVTDFCFDTYDAMYLASRLRTNLGDTAAQQASIVAVRQWENAGQSDIEAFNDSDADFTRTDPLSNQQERVKVRRRGGWEDVPKGMQYVGGPISSSSPIHIQVLDACLRGGGQRWQAPPWLMSGDMNVMSYANSLTAESPFVKTVGRRQTQYCEAFRRPVWFALSHRIKVRGLRVPQADGSVRVYQWDEIKDLIVLTVTAPSPQTRDKDKEAQTAKVEIDMGVQSPQGYMQEQGRDPDQVEADNKEWQQKHPPQQPPGVPGAPQPGGGLSPAPGGGDPFAGLAEATGLTESDLIESAGEWYTRGAFRLLLDSHDPAGGRDLLEARDLSKLVQKFVTDKNGHRRKVWVRSEQPAGGGQPRTGADDAARQRERATAVAERLLAGRLTSVRQAKQLAEALKTMTRKQIEGLKKAQNLGTEGGYKKDQIARLVAYAHARRKVKTGLTLLPPDEKPAPSAAPGEEKPAEAPERPKEVARVVADAPEPNAAARAVLGHLRDAPGLTPEQKQQCAGMAIKATAKMPPKAVSLITSNLKAASFYPSLPAMVDAVSRMAAKGDAAKERENRSKWAGMLGAYQTGAGTLHLDGDHDLAAGRGAGTYAHEFGHVIDHGYRFSGTKEWAAVFAAEIDVGGAPLTDYARTNTQEGFAEFARAAYVHSESGFKKLQERFPRATKFFKDNGLWPESSATSSPAAKT